ncbi:MAG: hypothetical protein ACREBS_03150 [Nitrososphaerales archaeon]
MVKTSSPDILSTPGKKFLAALDGFEEGYKTSDYAILSLLPKGQSALLFLYVEGASSAEHNYNMSADMAGSFEQMGAEVFQMYR